MPVTIPLPIYGVDGAASVVGSGGLCRRAPQSQVLGWGTPWQGDARGDL